MYSLDKFYSDVRIFSNSILVKITDIGRIMETRYIDPYRLKDTKISQWRYFKHLAGEYYTPPKDYGLPSSFADKPVMIKVIETEEVVVLTKEVLAEYKVTKDELLKQSDYYNNLIDNNKNMFLFIHGCLFNTQYSLEDILALEDGTILGYNTNHVESQEYTLVEDIQTYIKNFLYRWHVQDYILVDNLYASSLLAVLYTSLPNHIINLRLKNIRTKQVHSFFLESYFRSKFDLWDNVKVLSNETIIWLYLNLDYLIKHLGTNQTFQTLLDKVLSPNNVGLGGYILRRHDNGLDRENLYNILKQPFKDSKAAIRVEALNPEYILNDNALVTTKDTIKKEFNILDYYNSNKTQYLLDVYDKAINEKSKGENKTKVIEISTLKTFDGYNIDVMQVLIDYWAYLLSKEQYGSFYSDGVTTLKVEYIDPNTNGHYNLTSRQGFYMLLKMMLSAMKADNVPIEEFYISTVFDQEMNWDFVTEKFLFQDGYSSFIFKEMKDSYPTVNRPFTSAENVGEFLASVVEYYRKWWLYNANSENNLVSANIRQFLFMVTKHDKIKINKEEYKETIDELLRKESIIFKIPPQGYDYDFAIKELVKACLGVVVDDSVSIYNLIENYKQLIKKLTSYTLQTFGDMTKDSEHFVFYNSITPLLSQKGIIKLLADKIDVVPLDDTFFIPRFMAINPNNDVTSFIVTDDSKADVCDGNHIKGRVDLYKQEAIALSFYPSAVDIQNMKNDITNRVDKCPYTNPVLFLKDIKYIPNVVDYKIGMEVPQDLGERVDLIRDPEAQSINYEPNGFINVIKGTNENNPDNSHHAMVVFDYDED